MKKTSVKRDQFFSGDQYFFPINNFTRLKLTPSKNFYQLYFLLNKNQIPEISKKLSNLLYHNLVEWPWVGKGSKKGKFTADDQLKRRRISQNWSVTLTVVVKKKKTSTLTLILMNQLTWPLINFLFLK